jgi:RNA polymerase sigma-70 factor (ECF subfamily)
VEGEDIVQSVFRTFFGRSARGEFQISNAVEIWRLLVTITLTKVREQARRHTTAKRNMNAEDRSTDDAWLANAVASEPGPAEAAALLDQIEQLLSGLPEAYCEMLTMRLEGHSRNEIAEKLGVSRQTVYRVLGLMQQRLQAEG